MFRSDVPVNSSTTHFVNGAPIMGPFPAGNETLVVGMGCFWGAERKFLAEHPGGSPPRLDTQAGIRRTPPTRKCAAVVRGTPKW